MAEDNIGEVGVESIRINGQKIQSLPFVSSERVKDQIPLVLAHEKQQKIADILARYPRVTRDYVNARLRECTTAVEDFKRVKKETATKIADFTLLAQQQGGESFTDIEDELYAIGARTDISIEEKKTLIAERRANVSEYDPKNLYKQITQFQENIERLDDAIQAEQDSITELKVLLGQLQIRDAELKALGVTKIE
jgi:uncharacterized coiled-coil DUF342 family protein